MSKRKLSQQQQKRISAQRRNHDSQRDKKVILPEDSSLGEQIEGRVIANFGTQVLVQDSNKSVEQRCFLRANLDIVTGDYVVWRPGQELGVVESRKDRASELNRPDSYGKLRTVAANVTQMLITLASEPPPHCSLIDRYLVAAHIHNLKPILLINKVDQNDIPAESVLVLEEIEELYSSLGYSIIKVSAHSGFGDKALCETLQGQTSIFVGQSGVGKSSLVQMLLPDIDIRIGALSAAASKGRHTTTHSQLYHFPFGGDCVDSPGIREFGLWHASPNQILSGFSEIQTLSQQCKFRDCAHKHEPGCAILTAIENNDISIKRFESYALILNQLNDVTMKTQG